MLKPNNEIYLKCKSTQTEHHKQRKNIVPDKKCILWKNGSEVSKPLIQPFVHNGIYFDVKCEPFGVKRSMRPFWEQIKLVE